MHLTRRLILQQDCTVSFKYGVHQELKNCHIIKKTLLLYETIACYMACARVNPNFLYYLLYT